MKEFYPPFSERTTARLIEIANAHESVWRKEAIEEAKKELERRNVKLNNEDFDDDDDDYRFDGEFDVDDENLEESKIEGYSIIMLIGIYLLAPFLIVGKIKLGKNLWELKKFGYNLKFKQRLMTLILAIISWYFIITFYTNQIEEENQKEIDKIDISDWKKKYN